MDNLLAAAHGRLAVERCNKEKLIQCSRRITRNTFESFEAFPLDGSGRIMWHCQQDVLELEKQIQRFFEYDFAFSDGRAQAVWPKYLSLAFPWMEGLPLSDMLVALVVRAWYHRSTGASTLQSVEFFCGAANLTLAAVEVGLSCAAVDKALNDAHDVLEPEGLVLWLSLITATVPGALEWLGSPCNSYVVLCRAQSCRMAPTYLGDEAKFFVLEGNCLGDISSMLLWLGGILMLRPGLEQPKNSVLPYSGCMPGVLRFIGAEMTVTYHYCFGGPTLKPLQLWGCSPSFLRALERNRPAGVTQVEDEGDGLVTRDEQGGFTGDKARLKASQAYSKQFGRAIVHAFLSHQD